MLRLVYADGLSQRQVAERLQLSLSDVRSEMAHSLQVVCAVVCAAG